MRMHDFCRSLGIFKGKRSKKASGGHRHQQDGAQKKSSGQTAATTSSRVVSSKVIRGSAALVGPVFVTKSCDPWQKKDGDTTTPHEDKDESADQGTKVTRTASVKSDSSGRSKHSQRSEGTSRGSSNGYNGDRAFNLSHTPSSHGGNTREPPRRDEDSQDREEQRSVSRFIDDEDRECEDEVRAPCEGGGQAVTVSAVVKRSSTIALGDKYARQATGQLSCVERDRFLLEKKRGVNVAPGRSRPTRRESDRTQQRPHHHPHNHHHHHGRTRPNTAPSNTHQPSAQRRKTLSSVDANEVKMLALASKALTDHVKDMTEKTRTRCCGVPGKTEKENLINQNHGVHLGGIEPQNYIVDHARETTYIKGKLLGKGGFAKCYELTDIQTGKTYACKIISKNRLSKPHQKEKIAREVELHKHLNHQNVVGFHSYFEDNDNVYIVLEYCSRKSLVHVLRIRKTVTEPEVRCYLRQLVEGCRYIHSQRIIHRDLKLGNMLLSEGMNIKIADFGLATRVEYDGEKKMTVCGTPNYIAPEVLQKKGHSYEADIWAMGCIMYALLLGRPPFETSTLKETYLRITANKFSIPTHISPSARSLIQTLLTADPAQRPTLDKILEHDFFSAGYSPLSLPTSCCEHAPKFPQLGANNPTTIVHQVVAHLGATTTTTTPLITNPAQATQATPQRPKSYASPVSATEAMQRITSSLAQLTPMHCNNGTKADRARSPSPVATRTKSPSRNAANFTGLSGPAALSAASVTITSGAHRKAPVTAIGRPSSTGSSTGSEGSSHSYGSRPNSAEIRALPIGSSIRLYQLLTSCLDQMPDDSNPSAVHNAVPLWVTKWVDYSNKYGFGFQLSDRCVGVLFNDMTRMMLSADGEVIYYNDLSNKVYSFAAHAPPREHEKKGTLLKYFTQYMDEHLIHGGDLVPRAAAHPPGARLVQGGQGTFMKKWFRTGKAIVMYLNNGTLQVNFFDDHTKVILSPEGQDYLVTYINTHRQSVTYRLLHFRHFGCNAEIQQRLQYARRMLESIINIEGEPV